MLYIKHSLQLSLKRSAHVIAVSEKTREDLEALFNLDKKKVTVIHHGVTSLSPSSNAPRSGRSQETNQFADYLLFVGERRPHKNLENLILAFAIYIKKKGPEKLLIVGKSYSDYVEPERLVERLGIQDRVIFEGYIDDQRLERLYGNARLFILPSYYEGFGLPLFEAMSHGLPVIASDRSCIPELVGDSAWLIDPDSPEEIAHAMDALMSDEKKRGELVKKGRERISDLTWERTAGKTLCCYREIYQRCQ